MPYALDFANNRQLTTYDGFLEFEFVQLHVYPSAAEGYAFGLQAEALF
jgi:hypothetical protein